MAKLLVSMRCSFCNGFRCLCANYKNGKITDRVEEPPHSVTPPRSRPHRPRPPPQPTPPRVEPRVPESLDDLELPMDIGAFRLVSLGRVNTGPHFSVPRYIFPVGYKIVRQHTSFVNPDERVDYTCEILEGDNKPLFKVSVADSNVVFTADTPSGVWIPILKRVAEAKVKLDPNARSASTVSGPVQFGLAHPLVLALVRKLEDADQCPNFGGFRQEGYADEPPAEAERGKAEKARRPRPAAGADPSDPDADPAPRKQSKASRKRKAEPQEPRVSRRTQRPKDAGRARTARAGSEDDGPVADKAASASASGSASSAESSEGEESEEEEVGHLDPKDREWRPSAAGAAAAAPPSAVLPKQRRQVVFRTPAGEPPPKRVR